MNTQGTISSVVTLAAACLLLPACGATGTRPPEPPQPLYAPDAFDRGAERGPTIETLHSLAHVMAAQGRDGECEIVLEKLIETHPRFMPAYNELAELCMRQDRPEAARAALVAGLDVEPEDSVLLNNLGMLHFVHGEYGLALERFTAAAAVDTTDARSRANLAASLGMLGRVEECLAAYYLIVPPAEAHHNVAVLCEATGREQRAQLEFDRAKKARR